MRAQDRKASVTSSTIQDQHRPEPSAPNMPKNTIRPASRCWSNFDPPRDPRFPLSSFPDAHKPRSLQHGPLGISGTSSARESTPNYGPHGSAGGRHVGQPEHQLFGLITRIHPDGGNLTTRAFPRPMQAGSAISPRFHKRSRHAQGTTPEDHTTEIASDQVLYGAGDGNRTRVSSLGSWCSTIELHPQKGPR